MTDTKPSVSTWPVWVGGVIGGVAGLADGDLHLALPMGLSVGYIVYLRASTRAENNWLGQKVAALQQRIDTLEVARPAQSAAAADTGRICCGESTGADHTSRPRRPRPCRRHCPISIFSLCGLNQM